ncbi:hypothetical protein SAMN04489761_1080 [Tenacibaculum sp. MAR_2009_124]|uniref:hypothetical protein n=1 Tax=Tenacibaculum sp. MAR_2009_124 TaxID=1250059 RepID=UPI000897CEBD|nr:hypothetical protein [Tenacibaculum sp. MAR_2009_124]SEB50256.1 hypothetical protein SAMN04489761_1080 [Tenacibaculum sp. MAR_2009_124]
MNTIDWNEIANNAAKQTDDELGSQLAHLTNLKLVEVESFIAESKITNANAIKVLQIIDNAALANNIKAVKIETIENGINFLTKLASKVI